MFDWCEISLMNSLKQLALRRMIAMTICICSLCESLLILTCFCTYMRAHWWTDRHESDRQIAESFNLITPEDMVNEKWWASAECRTHIFLGMVLTCLVLVLRESKDCLGMFSLVLIIFSYVVPRRDAVYIPESIFNYPGWHYSLVFAGRNRHFLFLCLLIFLSFV